jgi:2-polyprenyl-6-methoxyphenol hydroxylase-like FAD-dependent oxidoreductase
MLAGSIGRDVPMAETWGRGVIFGVIPLADGRICCYAAARAEAGARSPDDRAELGRIFGRWHDPIPQLVAAAEILRHDVAALARPLPAFHRGRVCLLGDAAHPMAPNLGQGGNQALEDAAVLSHLMTGADSAAVPERLAVYTRERLARTTAIVRRSRRVAALMMWRSPLATAARDGAALAAGRLAPGMAIRGLAPVFDWTPPQGMAR